MKYYLYVSDAKVEMMFSQIPKGILQKIGTDLRVNLGIISLGVKEKSSQQNRYDRLRVVERYVDENMAVGTIDNPKDFFRGTMSMLWGPWERHGSREDFVYFAGSTDRTNLGLGGSLHHVIGTRIGDADYSRGASLTFFIVDILRRDMTHIVSDHSTHPENEQQGVLRAVQFAAAHAKGIEQRVEFLAKRLAEGHLDSYDTREKPHVLLGSPVYVALAE